MATRTISRKIIRKKINKRKNSKKRRNRRRRSRRKTRRNRKSSSQNRKLKRNTRRKKMKRKRVKNCMDGRPLRRSKRIAALQGDDYVIVDKDDNYNLFLSEGLKETTADGNCLFESLSNIVKIRYGITIPIQKMREYIIKMLLILVNEHNTIYEWETLQFTYGTTFPITDYPSFMIKNQVWGGQAEILSFVELFNIPILIKSERIGTPEQLITPRVNTILTPENPSIIYHLGGDNELGNHYAYNGSNIDTISIENCPFFLRVRDDKSLLVPIKPCNEYKTNTGKECPDCCSENTERCEWVKGKKGKKGYCKDKENIILSDDEEEDDSSIKFNKDKKILEESYKKVWDVKKDGLILAHTYFTDSNKTIRKIKEYPNIPKGWWMSEKFDGYRGIWNGKDLVSRTGNIFDIPDFFRKFLPKGVALDGELFLGRGQYQSCGLFRRKKPKQANKLKEWEEEWKGVTYQVFDIPTKDSDYVFEKRQNSLKDIVKRSKMLGNTPLVYVEQNIVKNNREVEKIMMDVINTGGEGVMLRAPNSPYVGKRTNLLLKVKPDFDDECIILEHILSPTPKSLENPETLTQKDKERLKEVKCKYTHKDGEEVIFKIGGGFTNLQREKKWYSKNLKQGTKITFKYLGFTENRIPRHATFLRVRDE